MLGPEDVDDGRGGVLDALRRVEGLRGQSEPVAASDLGARTLLSRSQVSRVLHALQVRGLIVRVPSPTDARSTGVRLTETGRQAFDAAGATRREAPADGFDDRLDEADIQALNAIWAKLKRKTSDAA